MTVKIILFFQVKIIRPTKYVFCLFRGTKVKSAQMVQQVQRYLHFTFYSVHIQTSD